MVAYNFQKQFAEPIRRGDKTHTIRRNGKRRHAEPGDFLQLYTGMRTKSCEKILDKDPVCRDAIPIFIDVRPRFIHHIDVERNGIVTEIENLELFASDDGFDDLDHFHRFWLDFHGTGTFEGTLISWGDFSLVRYNEWAKHFERCEWECLCFRELIPKIANLKGVGVYCDPPWIGAGRNYLHTFSEEDHSELEYLLRRFDATTVVIRYGDCATVRDLYSHDRWQIIEASSRTQSNAVKGEVWITNH